MKKLSLTKPYSVDELATELNLSTKLRNGMRNNFGDPISIKELNHISKDEFFQCDQFGVISWKEFSNALSVFTLPNKAVTLIEKPSENSIIVEINTSKPFGEVIQGLADIMKTGEDE